MHIAVIAQLMFGSNVAPEMQYVAVLLWYKTSLLQIRILKSQNGILKITHNITIVNIIVFMRLES